MFGSKVALCVQEDLQKNEQIRETFNCFFCVALIKRSLHLRQNFLPWFVPLWSKHALLPGSVLLSLLESWSVQFGESKWS